MSTSVKAQAQCHAHIKKYKRLWAASEMHPFCKMNSVDDLKNDWYTYASFVF